MKRKSIDGILDPIEVYTTKNNWKTDIQNFLIIVFTVLAIIISIIEIINW